MSEKHVNLYINGSKVTAREGTTVLDAALAYGICIPHLCHMDDILGYGACRLCIVEVIENNRSTVMTSCTIEVREGMVIEAHSEKILKARKNIAEMIVAECPNSRAIQDIAARCGVEKVRYPFRNNDCIQCGKCVRVCSEVWQSDSLGFIGRGIKREHGTPFNKKSETCKMCLTCVDICPMTITPCPGPMKDGEEYLCSKCISQLSMIVNTPDTCIRCDLGEGFNCINRKK
jgi:formate dehydrogenase alpha subunit